MVRPIDIFPLIVRLLSTAATRTILDWKREVLHRGQYASRGGNIPATTRLAIRCEQVIMKTSPTYSLTADFSKLFNMISPSIAAHVCYLMGLNEASASRLIEPLINAKGYWRLPDSATTSPQPRARGLPQGMSGSVLLSEVFTSCVLWKIERTTIGTEVIGYVDDLTLISSSPHMFLSIIDTLKKFEEDFELDINVLKICLWGTDGPFLKGVAEKYGFTVSSSFVAVLHWGWSGTSLEHIRCMKKSCHELLNQLIA